MKTKKQIDRLFTEQFKDFEVTPPPAVWENISEVLKKDKKERRILPFYYRIAGIAALLLIVFSIAGLLQESGPVPLTNTNFEDDILPQNEKQIVYQSEEGEGIVENASGTPENTERIEKTTLPVSGKMADVATEGVLRATETGKQSQVALQKNDGFLPGTVSGVKESQPALADGDVVQKEPIPFFTEKNPVMKNTATFAGLTEVASEEPKKSDPDNKKSLIEVAPEQKEVVAASEVDKNKSRWGVSTNFAPVYYNTIGKGSSIDPQFNDNPKSGDVNFSYGVQVSYAFNDKVSIRTGVQKVALRYATDNVDFGVSSPSAALKSINYNTRGYIIAVGNPGTLPPPQTAVLPTSDDGYPVVIPRSGVQRGSLSQQLDYLEVPLELSYTVLNSRIGIHVIGGLSTLFLGTNEISVNAEGFETVIGEANNLNPVSFSSNLGLGFNYKISRRLLFNLEPIFKYQLNPYSDSSVDFKPYYLGVHSGFSYKF